MKKYKAIILDDEVLCIKALEMEIAKSIPEVEIITTYMDPRKALVEMNGMAVDILFLDIDMPWMNGFEFLTKANSNEFTVIFTTAYNEYAIEAFRANAVDYLLKPVELIPLRESIEKAIVMINATDHNQNIEELIIRLSNMRGNGNLSIPTRSGFEFIPINQILYCKSENNYCHIYVSGEKSRFVSRTLKDIASKLPTDSFIRIHQSYLINIDFVKGYSREDGGQILLTDGTKLPVSKTKKQHVLEALKSYSNK